MMTHREIGDQILGHELDIRDALADARTMLSVDDVERAHVRFRSNAGAIEALLEKLKEILEGGR